MVLIPSATDRAGKPQLEVTVRIEPEREGCLALASGRTASARRTSRCRRRRSSGCDDAGRSRNESRRFLGLRFDDLGSLVDFLVILFGGEPLFDLGLLVVDRRLDRRQAGRMRTGVLDDILAERVVGFGDLGRFEAHVVPAQVLEAVGRLAKTLRPHGRTGCALASEEA